MATASNTTGGQHAIAPAIDGKLRRIRAWKLALGLASVVILGCAALAVGMLVSMLIDWLTLPGNGALRPWLTAAPLLASALVVVRGAWRVFERDGRLRRAATDVDSANPEFEERWSTLTETVAMGIDDSEAHPAMFRQLVKEAGERVEQVAPVKVASPKAFLLSSIVFVVALITFFVPVLWDQEQAKVLMQRFWSPSQNITLTRLEGLPAEMVVAEGEAAVLEAQLAGRVPEQAMLVLQKSADRESRIELDVDEGAKVQVSYRVSDVDKPFSFRWEAGDARSDWLPVVVTKRPKISAVRFVVTPPSYTKRPVVRRSELPSRERVIEGSVLEVAFRSAEPVQDFQLDFGKDKSQKLTADSDGWYRWRTDIREGFTFSPLLTESHGLTNRKPRPCNVVVYRDQAPAVKVVSPTSQMAVQPKEQIDIQFVASDDIAVNRAELVVYSEQGGEKGRQEMKTIPIDLGKMQGAQKVKGAVKLDLAEFDLRDGQAISYAVRVYDNRVAPVAPGSTPSLEARDIAAADSTRSQSQGNNRSEASPGAQGSPSESQTASDGTRSPPRDPANNSGSPAGQPSKLATASTSSEGSPNRADGTPPTEGTTAVKDNAAADPSQENVASAGRDDSKGGLSTKDAKGVTVAQDRIAPKDMDDASNGKIASSDPSKEAASEGTPTGQTPSDATSNSQTAAQSTGSPSGKPAASESMPSKPREDQKTSPSATSPAANAVAKTDNDKPMAGTSSGKNAAQSGTPQNATGSGNSQTKGGESKTASAGGSKGGNAKPNPSDKEMTKDKPDLAKDKTEEEKPSTATSNEGRLIATTETKKEGDDQPVEADKDSNPDSTNSKNGKSIASGGANQQQQPAGGGGSKKQGDVAVPEGMEPLRNAKKQKDGENSEEKKEEQVANKDSANNPGDSMTRRMLDLESSQSGSSQRMQLKIDQWAGTFDGQRREKLAIAISPVLNRFDEYLAEAEQMTNNVAERLERGEPWVADQQRLVDRAEKLLKKGEEVVGELHKQTADTPYAFIGLQLNLIAQTHLVPARDSLWEAQQADGKRAELVRSAWQEITRARSQLAELTKTFERIHREHKLAEATEKIKKMYRVFVEDSMAMLGPQKDDINNFERKMVEFDLDEEYLKRLQEVLKMREKLRAELAKMLTDDPRLMRRFMDSLMSRGDNLRDQLTLLAERQKQLAREVRAWAEASEEDRPGLLAAIVRMRQLRLEEISLLAANQNEKLVTWLPLDLKADHPAFQEAMDISKDVAAKAQLLALSTPDKTDRTAKSQDLYNRLGDLDAALRRVDLGTEHDGLENHLLGRLTEVRKLTLLTSSWIRQAEMLDKGQYWQEAAIEQYKLAMETDALAAKLANLERQLSDTLSQSGGQMSTAMAEKTRALLATLDKELSANQLAATFALRREQGPGAVEKETAAVAAFDKAEGMFDDLMRTVIDEMDKLPVQDPIASLLDDPTLDELLAELENEIPLNELLGIPNRPSNLRIIGDWMRPGGGGGGGGGGSRGNGGGRMISAKLRRDADKMRRNAEDAHRRALARALKEEEEFGKTEAKPRTLVERVEWNTLLSKLGDDLLQGKGELLPQEYRRAIEQYLARISELENSQERVEKAE